MSRRNTDEKEQKEQAHHDEVQQAQENQEGQEQDEEQEGQAHHDEVPEAQEEDQQDLFKEGIRTKLRALGRSMGFSARELDQVHPDDLGSYLQAEQWKRKLAHRHRASLPHWIEAGYVTQDAYRLRRHELRDLADNIGAYEDLLRKQSELEARPPAQHTELSIPNLTRGEVVALFGDAVIVIAALRAEVDALRNEVASLKNAKLAVFGKQAVIDQLSAAPRDFEGVDVLMELAEEELSSSSNIENASESDRSSSKKSGDLAAKVDGLASMVAGLNLGGQVDLREMNDAARELVRASKNRARTKSRGKVRIKINKVSRG